MAIPSLLYDGKKIIPIPFVSIRKVYQKGEDGSNLGTVYAISLTGQLVAWRGSPASVEGETDNINWAQQFWVGAGSPPDEDHGSIDSFQAILRKQEAIRKLFATQGLLLEITPCDGSPPLKCNPRVLEITFPEGNWVERCSYTIELEADIILGKFITGNGEDAFEHYISSASEAWSLEFDEPQNYENQHTFRLTHTVLAKGKLHFEEDGIVLNQAWQEAKAYCVSKLGYDPNQTAPAGDGYAGYNYVRAESSDEIGGNYQIAESWIVSKGDALEDFSVSTRTSLEDPYTTVSIEGNIRGLETNNISDIGDVDVVRSKYLAASGYFDTISAQLYTRALAFGGALGASLNTVPQSSQVGRNPITGTINYAYEYNTRPRSCITNAKSELITVSDENPADLIARLFIIGRANGPILQDLNTTTGPRRTVNIEVVMNPATGCLFTAAGVAAFMSVAPTDDGDSIMNAFEADLENSWGQVFRVQDTPSWNGRFGRYSRTCVFEYGNC
jgi:hypothetical protein